MKWLGASLFLRLVSFVSLDPPLFALGAPEQPFLIEARSMIARSAPSAQFLPLDEITIDDLITYFTDGTLTSVDLVRVRSSCDAVSRILHNLYRRILSVFGR